MRYGSASSIIAARLGCTRTVSGGGGGGGGAGGGGRVWGGAAVVREVELDDRVVAAQLARPGDQLVDAVLVDRERLLHGVAAAGGAAGHAQRRRAGDAARD